MNKPYNTALIFSGGGSRFGYYMGMYGALCELGKQPDIIIASCGGAHISGLLSLCPDYQLAKQMMLSRPFYEMLCRVQPIKATDDKRSVLKSAGKRWLHCQKAKLGFVQSSKQGSNRQPRNKTPLPSSLIDSLYRQALYKVADESMDNPFWDSEQLLSVIDTKSSGIEHADTELHQSQLSPTQPPPKGEELPSFWEVRAEKTKHCFVHSQDKGYACVGEGYKNKVEVGVELHNFNHCVQQAKKIHSLIVASRSVDSSHLNANNQNNTTTNKNEDGFFWQQVLWSDNEQLSKNLQQLQSQGKLTANISDYSQHIIDDVHIEQALPLAMAVRISINDMFYFPPIRYQNHTMLGGVIDLLPIELACQLADTIYAERKSPFDRWLAEPAIHSVFGFFANDRRDTWHNHPNSKQINWIDTSDNYPLLAPALSRKAKPLQGYIDLNYPTYEEFVKIMQAQYEYGYQKVIEAGN